MQIVQDLGSDPIVAQVLFKSEVEVGLDRIKALVLERVGPDFIGQTDAPALLMQVQDNAFPLFGNIGHGLVQLLATVAPLRTKHVAGQALGVNPD